MGNQKSYHIKHIKTGIFNPKNKRIGIAILCVIFGLVGLVMYDIFWKEQDLKEIYDLKMLQKQLAEHRELEKVFTENGNTKQKQVYALKCDSIENNIEKLKETISKVYETTSNLPLDGELYRKIKPYIDRGEFRKVNHILKNADLDLSTKRAKEQKKRATGIREETDKALKINAYLYLVQAELWKTFYSEPNREEKTMSFYEKSLDAHYDPKNAHQYALFLQRHNKFKKARTLYEKNLIRLKFLAKKNPDTYLPDVAETLKHLAIIHQHEQRFSQSLEMFQKALKMYSILADKNPDAYLPNVAETLDYLASLHSDEGRYSQAIEIYQKALKIRRALADKNPDAYLPDVAMNLHYLASLYSNEQRFSEASEMYKEVLEIAKEFPQVAHVQYCAYYARRALEE